jgi:hypothetical protein
MNNRRVFVMIMLFLLPTLACGLVDQVLEPQSTLAPPPTIEGGLPPTSTLQPDGEATAGGAAATPTLAVSPSAAAPTLEELGTPPETLEALREWIAESRAVEANVGDVCAVLQDATWRQMDDTCEATDLDGDDQQEWLLTIDTSRLQENPAPLVQDGHPGDFWIASRDGIVYQTRDVDEPEFFATAPALVELIDMTGDDRPEAVTVSTTCGAHTCYNYYQVIGAHGGSIRNLVDASGQTPDASEPVARAISMAYVDQQEIRDANGDELPDLVIQGGIVGSAGAGIQRARTEIWAWDGEAITLAEQEWQETDYRFHWLYNANYAFEQQAFDLARARYEEVIVNPNLEDVEGFGGSAQQVRDYARQYAAFRLSLLPLLRGDITESTRWRNWLNVEYPEAPITAAADRLFAVWDSNGNDLAAACNEVTAFLQSTDNPTGPLVDMGYNNPSLTAETLCQLE